MKAGQPSQERRFSFSECPVGDAGFIRFPWLPPATAATIATECLRATAQLGTYVLPNVHLKFRWASQMLSSPSLLSTLNTLLGPDVAVENTFLIAKPPHSVSAVPPHQDGTNDTLLLDPAKSGASWLAIADATLCNGCRRIYTGSHRFGYLAFCRAARDPTSVFNGTPGTIADQAHLTVAKACDLTAGQALAFDVRLIHDSLSNESPDWRIGLNIRLVAPGAVLKRDASAGPMWAVTGSSARVPYAPDATL